VSRGSILGDKTRMEQLSRSDHAFIRPSPSGGSLGGVARKTRESILVCEAAGFDMVLVETVGVGQSELEVAHSADTTIVVLVPQSGDAIQAMKAGLMEIADIFVINKCDRDGADQAYRELMSILHLREDEDGWQPPVIKTIAETGEGVAEVLETIERHARHLRETGKLELRRRGRAAAKTRRLVEDELRRKLWQGEREQRRTSGLDGVRSPYLLARELIDDFYREIRDE